MTITSEFTVGSQEIRYALVGRRVGRDWIQEGTERIDGSDLAYGSAFVDGHLVSRGDTGWIATEAAPELAGLLADNTLSFRNAVVLEDLGPDPDTGGYRLNISAGLALFPPQMSTMAIPDAHDTTERLEITVSPDGQPLHAVYTKSLSGTIGGQAATASGRVDYEFHDVGSVERIELPELVPGATLAPPATPTPAPSPATWTAFDLGEAPYGVEMPGKPTVSSTTVSNPTLGPLVQTTAHVSAASGATYVALELALPEDYIQDQGATAVARELVEIEARKDSATVAGLRVLDATGPAGIEALMTNPQGALLRLRVYVFDDDTLQMAVIGRLDLVASAEADRFLGSLRAVP